MAGKQTPTFSEIFFVSSAHDGISCSAILLSLLLLQAAFLLRPVSGDAIPTTMRDLNPPASPATPSNETTSLSVSDDDIIHGFKKLLCEMDHLNKTQILENSGVPYCNASHDRLTCWPPTEAGQNVSMDCPPGALPFKATRFCLDTGEWAAFTHYNDCHTINMPVAPPSPTFYLALRYVYLIGITLSLVLLLITLFIFCYFKALQCTRIAIHKNLVVSFIFRYIFMIIQLQPLLTMDYSTEISLSSSNLQENSQNNFVLHKVVAPPSPTFYLALRYVYLIGITLSLVLLLITLFIFCYFKALQCTRIAIHKNLVVSFIFRYIFMIIQLQPLLTMDYSTEIRLSSSNLQENSQNNFVLHKVPGFCRFILVLLEYFIMANMYWMFVEGLYLTSRIAVAVFSTESNFKVYLAIGWVSPLLFVIPWAIVMSYDSISPCWLDHLDNPYIWTLRAPLIIAILINTLFLINIIRILITKLQASNTMETNQMRKATKAVAVLFPLLGLTNLIFFWNVKSENEAVEKAFIATNAVLQSTQGVFVAVIYCFLNTEVRKLVKRRVLASLDEYGKRTPRRSHQYHTTNGSCGVPTTSEVVMAVSYRRSTQDQSTIADPDQYTEMKPFTSECGES
eukprot:XP_790450.3 PREDICTED: diuretic hormone receptor [Strongylocentrotus purpuratus]